MTSVIPIARTRAECPTIGFVSVPQQIARCSVPGKRLGHLARKPILRGIWCDLKVDNPSAINPQHDQGVAQLERRRGDHEHVNCRDVWKVVAQKAPPGRGGRPWAAMASIARPWPG